jgi:hypothetical protein
MIKGWKFFLDYSPEIIFGLVLLYNAVVIYVDHFAVNKDTISGDELVHRYVKLTERRKKA